MSDTREKGNGKREKGEGLPVDAEENFYSLDSDDADDIIDSYANEMKLKPSVSDDDEKISDTPAQIQSETHDKPKPRTFHSKKFFDSDAPDDEPKRKRKLSPAETSGIAISAVMLVYSLATQDKPLGFLSAALLTFLLRPVIGGLFGEHSRAVQNALHSFSVVLFIGALLFLFL